MNNNASSWRKEGIIAFCPEDDPEKECPYKTVNSVYARRCWIEGWFEEAREYHSSPEEPSPIEQIKEAIDNLPLTKVGCDGTLLMTVDDYNDLVELVRGLE